ncbi:MAG: hypothetical protein J2P23_13555, partial [Microlunatus sp.]|nr:hypothetical protein [Microlunatus sp.]
MISTDDLVVPRMGPDPESQSYAIAVGSVSRRNGSPPQWQLAVGDAVGVGEGDLLGFSDAVAVGEG